MKCLYKIDNNNFQLEKTCISVTLSGVEMHSC